MRSHIKFPIPLMLTVLKAQHHAACSIVLCSDASRWFWQYLWFCVTFFVRRRTVLRQVRCAHYRLMSRMIVENVRDIYLQREYLQPNCYIHTVMFEIHTDY